jgi:hypothetical protein
MREFHRFICGMFHMETAVPVKKKCWSAGSEKDEVSFEAFLVDNRSAFERGENGAFGLREPKAGFDERVDHERGIDGNQESFKTSVLERRDKNCFAIAGEVGEFLGRDEIDLAGWHQAKPSYWSKLSQLRAAFPTDSSNDTESSASVPCC